jgi:hypothetical protein
MSQPEQELDPPLKRGEPTIPYYWTVEELAAELGVTIRKVQYDITGSVQRKHLPCLNAYKVGNAFLVAEADAIQYIIKERLKKKQA